ncbi:MAG: aspartate aminotransferase family protein [Alcanivoracaceae bacterium]|nr:aspartate aminotransferase family protein [Alcanivoracaceae bacterium]
MTDKYLMPTYARQPVTFVTGEGCRLTDSDGRQYLDVVAGIAVCNLGHCHPAVTRAIQAQAGTLVHTSNLYHIQAQETLAEKLCQASGMEKVFFSNSGAEANEAAIKLARLHGHRKGSDNPTVIVMDSAFHGRTMATLTATGNRKAQAGFEPLLSGFSRAPFNDVDAVRRIIEHNKDVAAVLVEPVQGEGGVNVPDPDYLARLSDLCEEHDLLLMLDEIQTGNGRTGSYFAFQQIEGCKPDVVTTAKGLGNGFPIGACLVANRASELFGPGSHGSTYGGNPLGCAAALAVVETLQDGIIDSVHVRGQYLRQTLTQRFADHAMFREVRGQGLINAMQLDRDCPELVGLCRERGLLINVTAGSVIRMVPPLVISEAEIDEMVNILEDAIKAFSDSQEAA